MLSNQNKDNQNTDYDYKKTPTYLIPLLDWVSYIISGTIFLFSFRVFLTTINIWGDYEFNFVIFILYLFTATFIFICIQYMRMNLVIQLDNNETLNKIKKDTEIVSELMKYSYYKSKSDDLPK